MLTMFKTFKSVGGFSAALLGTACVTHYSIQSRPKDEQAIIWEHFMDPEGCQAALKAHERSKLKPK